MRKWNSEIVTPSGRVHLHISKFYTIQKKDENPGENQAEKKFDDSIEFMRVYHVGEYENTRNS